VAVRTATLALAAVLLLALVACDDDPAPGTAGPTPAPTEAAAPPSTPAATPTALPTLPQPSTPAPGTQAELQALLDSLDRTPRDMQPDRERVLPQPPASPFPEHDRESTVLYDTVTGEVHDFGPGDWGFFSPDGRYMAWISRVGDAPELRVVDLRTFEERSLGAGSFIGAPFVDAQTVAVHLGGSGGSSLVDVTTGERRPFPADMIEPARVISRQGDLGVALVREDYALVTLPDGEVLAGFSAVTASFAGPGELLVATPWTGELGHEYPDDVEPGTVNVYLIDLDALEATFIATIALDTFPSLPLAGSSEVIAWMENYCNWPDPQGVVWYYDRVSDELVRLDRGAWITVTPDGRLGYGEFGPHVLLDRHTLEYEVVLPEGTIDVNWSPDFRYASRGMLYGHGGYCPP
jgi:hypothetical protein